MRAVILLLTLQALPARWQQASLQRIVTTPLDAGSRSLSVRAAGRNFTALWLHQDRGDHLAILDPLGGPLAVLRSDGDRLGLQLRGQPEIVARANEAIELATDGAITLADLGGLLLGRLPAGTAIQRIHGGWSATRGPLTAELELDGTLRWARWRNVVLRDGTLHLGGQTIAVQVGDLQERAVPRAAFEVAAGSWIPVETVARTWVGVSDR